MILAAAACVMIGDPVSRSWGGDAPSVVTLRSSESAVAEVVFRNSLTFGAPFLPFTLQSGDIAVHVSIQTGDGRIPDLLTVEVPEGLVAVPHSQLVADETIGVTRIYCAETMGMG